MLGSCYRLNRIAGVSDLLVNIARKHGYFQTRISVLIYDLSRGQVPMREVHEVAAYLILKNEYNIVVDPDNAVKAFNQVENGRELTIPHEKTS